MTNPMHVACAIAAMLMFVAVSSSAQSTQPKKERQGIISETIDSGVGLGVMEGTDTTRKLKKLEEWNSKSVSETADEAVTGAKTKFGSFMNKVAGPKTIQDMSETEKKSEFTKERRAIEARFAKDPRCADRLKGRDVWKECRNEMYREINREAEVYSQSTARDLQQDALLRQEKSEQEMQTKSEAHVGWVSEVCDKGRLGFRALECHESYHSVIQQWAQCLSQKQQGLVSACDKRELENAWAERWWKQGETGSASSSPSARTPQSEQGSAGIQSTPSTSASAIQGYLKDKSAAELREIEDARWRQHQQAEQRRINEQRARQQQIAEQQLADQCRALEAMEAERRNQESAEMWGEVGRQIGGMLQQTNQPRPPQPSTIRPAPTQQAPSGTGGNRPYCSNDATRSWCP